MANILLADDAVEFRRCIATLLTEAGHHVIEQADGSKVVELCRDGKIDLVLIDLVMPDVEGAEAIIALRRELPELPVVAMSGANQGRTYLQMAKMLGARRTLLKPFALDELRQVVADTLFTGPSAA